MSSPAYATPDAPGRASSSNTSLLKALPAQVLGLFRRLPELLRYAWKKERHWLLVLIPLLATLIPFLVTARDTWFGGDAPFWFQPLVPFLAFSLAWERRDEWQSLYKFQTEQFPVGHKRRRGFFFPVVLSCFFFLLGSLTAIFAFWVIGFLLCLISILYYLYGAEMLKPIWMPLTYLVLMLPVPLGLMMTASNVLQKTTLFGLSTILGPFKGGAHIVGGGSVETPSLTVPVTFADAGRSIMFPVLALTLWIAMRRRVPVFSSLILFVAAIVLSFAVNLLRLFLPALAGQVLPQEATTVLNVALVFLVLWPVSILAHFFVSRKPSAVPTAPDGWPTDGWTTR